MNDIVIIIIPKFRELLYINGILKLNNIKINLWDLVDITPLDNIDIYNFELEDVKNFSKLETLRNLTDYIKYDSSFEKEYPKLAKYRTMNYSDAEKLDKIKQVLHSSYRTNEVNEAIVSAIEEIVYNKFV